MANLKEIRGRINSVKTTRQVTSAMKMVSAAKFKKAQDDVDHIRPFVHKLQQIVGFLAASVDDIGSEFKGFKKYKTGKILMVAIASNKGLAGAFSSNIVKEVDRLMKEDYAADYAAGDVELVAIGKQVTKGLLSRQYKVANSYNELLDAPTQQAVYEVAGEFVDKFYTGQYRQIVLVYNEFVNAAVQRVSLKQLLPLSISEQDADAAYHDFIIEPNKQEVLEALIPQAVRSVLYSAMLESLASEHGARMTAMSKATDNATELLGDLQLLYNKARQGAITNELIEIVSGAEALNG